MTRRPLLRTKVGKVALTAILFLLPNLAGCQIYAHNQKYVCGVFDNKKIKIPSNELFFKVDFENDSDSRYWWDCDRPREIRSINLIYTYPQFKVLTEEDWNRFYSYGNDVKTTQWKNFITLSISENSNSMDWQVHLEKDILPWSKLYKYDGLIGNYKKFTINGPIRAGSQDVLTELFYSKDKGSIITCSVSRRELIEHVDIGVCELKFYNPAFGEMVRAQFYRNDLGKADSIIAKLNSVLEDLVKSQEALWAGKGN